MSKTGLFFQNIAVKIELTILLLNLCVDSTAFLDFGAYVYRYAENLSLAKMCQVSVLCHCLCPDILTHVHSFISLGERGFTKRLLELEGWPDCDVRNECPEQHGARMGRMHSRKAEKEGASVALLEGSAAETSRVR